MSNVASFFKQPTKFVLSAVQKAQYPNIAFPEIAFIGRSNVGKSSLINALFTKKIALTSNTPGKTRQINFFNHSDKLMVVDLPGYGYAKVSKKEAGEISQLVSNYLSSRLSLKKLFVLIDNTLGPKDIDLEILEYMESIKDRIVIIFTKKDKKIKETSEKTEKLKNNYENFTISSKNNDGIFDVQKIIYNIL
ncbi:ribosome biogenesis GTP-binding protein YihA/YsxC [Alphaproteobacteria bacterium]|jgi:GTP-binding protein|nr:ribosome biogenesis GTP-binding protein YihA/YsxC [Alphaproteobacteria bacterium]MDB4184243.1 ribosome biogenesis GTP-binding protein YihA/YsxC [Alphaproteobacteria bacterium]